MKTVFNRDKGLLRRGSCFVPEFRNEAAAITELAQTPVDFLVLLVIHDGPELIVRNKTTITGAKTFKHGLIGRREFAEDHYQTESDTDEERNDEVFRA